MKKLILLTLLALTGAVAHAQYIYTHVEQNNVELTQLGTACYDVKANVNPTVEFVNGKAVMTNSDLTIATLPMSDNGQLVVEFETTKSNSELNTVVKTPTEKAPYVTLYSPFRLVLLTAEGGVYAPSYDADKNALVLSEGNKMTQYQTVLPETPLTICGTTEPVRFTMYMYYNSTFTKESALSGSSLKVAKPTDGKVFTYGTGKNGQYKGQFGLFLYTGDYVNPGVAYLKTAIAQKAPCVSIIHDGNNVTGIKDINTKDNNQRVGKYVENGSVVIRKAGKKFNINGQEIQ